MIEQNSENPEPLALDKAEVKYLLAKSGVEEEKLETFDEQYDSAAGEHSTLLASNIANLKKFEIKTPDITIQVNPECADLVETRIIDGQKCLVIVVDIALRSTESVQRLPYPEDFQSLPPLMRLMNPKAIHPKMKWMFHSKCLTYLYERHFLLNVFRNISLFLFSFTMYTKNAGNPLDYLHFPIRNFLFSLTPFPGSFSPFS